MTENSGQEGKYELLEVLSGDSKMDAKDTDPRTIALQKQRDELRSAYASAAEICLETGTPVEINGLMIIKMKDFTRLIAEAGKNDE